MSDHEKYNQLLAVMLSASQKESLRREAFERKTTIGAVVRERLFGKGVRPGRPVKRKTKA